MLKNWRTTLTGIIGAVVQYAVMAGPTFSLKMLVASLPTLVLGVLAKDNNVTGV